MGIVNQVKFANQGNEHAPLRKGLIAETRLNVNKLMKRRQEERRIDRKNWQRTTRIYPNDMAESCLHNPASIHKY